MSKLSNPTLVKVRNVMVAIFKHGQRYGLLPRTQEANPMIFVRQSSVSDYEGVILTFSQCVEILANLDGMHRVLVLADAATGLRISEILALLWSNVDKAHSCIHVTRAYVYGRFGPPKSKASKKPVPLHPLLAEGAGYLAQRNSLSGRRRLGFSEHAVEGSKTTTGEHVGSGSPSTCSTKSRHQGARRLPHPTANFGECVSRERKRHPIGCRTVATF
jgi:integrase